MLNATTIKRQSIGSVVNYYKDGADDYYAKEDGAHAWQGGGAEILGIGDQSVEKEKLRTLLDGQISEQLHLKRSVSDRSKERLAIDLTFSAPKSVSLQALVNGDERIINAHNQAVSAAISEAEKFAAARVTKKGVVAVELTNNLVVAKFRHETSREQEQQLHTHAVVMNMTRRSDGQWRALMNDYIFKNVEHISHVYNAHLSKSLEKMGFAVRYEKNGSFDLAHISAAQIDGFSARRAQIDQELQRLGLERGSASPQQRSAAALKTRQHKRSVDRVELHRAWQLQARALGIDFTNTSWADDPISSQKKETPTLILKSPQEHGADAIRFAVFAEFERQAVVSEKDLMRRATIHGMGKTTPEVIRQQLDRAVAFGTLIRAGRMFAATNMKDGENKPVTMTRSEWVKHIVESLGRTQIEAERLVTEGIKAGRLIDQGALYTTERAINCELNILARERAGRGSIENTVSSSVVNKFLSASKLSEQQRAAVVMATQTRHRFVGIQGYAGVGKSYQTKISREILQASGYRVEALAPYSSQKNALEKEGIHARTVAAFLASKDKRIDEKTVVFIDEAGVIPARQMETLMGQIEQYGARAVFMGDVAQTKAIEAGKPFEQMISQGMTIAKVTEIQRQKKNPELLKAVQFAAEGKIDESLLSLDKTIHVKEDQIERLRAVAQAFSSLTPKERAETIVITGTNDARQKLNRLIRTALGTAGKGVEADTLVRVDTTQAERNYSKYYQKDLIVLPERNYADAGLEQGKLYRVLDTGPGNKLKLENVETKSRHSISPKDKSFSVYAQQRQELSEGDRVRLTRNERNQNLANGQIFEVKHLRENFIELRGSDGQNLTVGLDQKLFLDMAYVMTVHSAQGHTSERAILDLDTKSRTTSKEVFYVGASRARSELTIFTDNKSRLPVAAKRETVKHCALDVRPDSVSRRALRRNMHVAEAGEAAINRVNKREKDREEKSKPSKWLENLRKLTRFRDKEHSNEKRQERKGVKLIKER